jgi:23S rRNA pseudouridine1911/1915/1917 synthase
MKSMIEVLYSDNHVLAVLKPAGVPVVPDASEDFSVLEMAKSWVKSEFQKSGNVFLGVVHRLDRPVSGIVVFARTSKGAAVRLKNGIKHFLAHHGVKKK